MTLPADFRLRTDDDSPFRPRDFRSLPSQQQALERALSDPAFSARTVRILANLSGLAPDQVREYCDASSHITKVAAKNRGEYYGWVTRAQTPIEGGNRASSRTDVFLCYRSEHDATAGRFGDELEDRFGAERVFRDVERLHIGDWRAQIDAALDQTAIVIVLIGPHWLEQLASPDGRRDEVVYEIVQALQRRIQLLPVTIEGAKLPERHSLPSDIAALLDAQGSELGYGRAWKRTVTQLIDDLEAAIAPK
jgi:hypothetical protein